VILRIYRHPGEAVGLLGISSAVLQMGNLDNLVVRAQIDEADIAHVTQGARAYVTAPAYPGKKFGGKITEISPRLGAKTIQSGAPSEKRDTSVLDVLVTLDPGVHLPVGLRVDCYLEPRSAS
jgi:HlyD family secretion protein